MSIPRLRKLVARFGIAGVIALLGAVGTIWNAYTQFLNRTDALEVLRGQQQLAEQKSKNDSLSKTLVDMNARIEELTKSRTELDLKILAMNRAPQTRPALVVPPKTVATSARSSDQVRLANSRKTLDGGQGNPVPTVYVGRTYAVMYGNASSASYRVGNGEGGSDGGGGGTITTGPGRYDVFDPYYTPKIGGGG